MCKICLTLTLPSVYSRRWCHVYVFVLKDEVCGELYNVILCIFSFKLFCTDQQKWKCEGIESGEYGGFCGDFPFQIFKIQQRLFCNMRSCIVLVERDKFSILKNRPFFFKPSLFTWRNKVEISIFRRLSNLFSWHSRFIIYDGKQGVIMDVLEFIRSVIDRLCYTPTKSAKPHFHHPICWSTIQINVLNVLFVNTTLFPF